jgi:thymidine kinase
VTKLTGDLKDRRYSNEQLFEIAEEVKQLLIKKDLCIKEAYRVLRYTKEKIQETNIN